MIRRVLVLVLGVAVLANAVLLLDALTGAHLVPSVLAQETASPQPEGGTQTDSANSPAEAETPLHPAEMGPEEAAEVYRRLIAELQQQKAALDARARELIERERQLEVVKAELQAEREAIEKRRTELANQQQKWESAGKPNFDRLLKAYEGMEPENAASALAELYGKDRQVVVDLLLGLKPRQAAQTFDALASTNPAIAANLSLQIWKQDPKVGR